MDVPYWVGVVQFDDDLCVMGLLEQPVSSELSIGLPAATTVLEAGDGALNYGFRVI